MTDWQHDLHRADARYAQARAERLRRRADVLSGAAQQLGGQQAVADALGVSKQAISKEVRAGASALTDRMPDHLVLDLPRTGRSVPTAAEWAQLDAGEQRDEARHAADTWCTIATVTTDLAESLHREAEDLAEALDDADTPDRMEGLRCRMLSDLVASLMEQSRAAWEEHARWRQRAGDDHGMHHAD